MKSGFLTKLGFQVQNWKRRYVVLYNNIDNFTVHYYTDEQTRHERGSISLYGYFVRSFNEKEEKKHGSYGIVLQHRLEGRRRWMMRADTSKEQNDWIQALTAACNLAVRDARLPLVIQESFRDALKTTRSIYGLFGSCVPRGRSEEELLLALITNVLRREVLENSNTSAGHSAGKVIAAGQRSVRTNPAALAAAREAQRKQMERHVQPLVRAQWEECLAQAIKQGPILARKLQPSLRLLTELERKVIAHIDADIGELVQPIALEQYSRVLEPLVSRCIDPLLAAWEKALSSLVRCVLEQTTGAASANLNIRTVAAEIHKLASGATLLQGIGGEGPLAGAVLALWRLETEDLGAGLAETFAPSDALDLALAADDHTLRNNLMMNAANAGEELSPEAAAGLAAAQQQKNICSGEAPVCDGRLFTAMVLDVVDVAQDFLATVDRLLLRPEEAMPLLWTLHEQNVRNLHIMEQIMHANGGSRTFHSQEPKQQKEEALMAAVTRSFSLNAARASSLSAANSFYSGGASMSGATPKGLGDGYWMNDGFRTVRFTVPGREAEVLGIIDESATASPLPPSSSSSSGGAGNLGNNPNTGNSNTGGYDDLHQTRDEENLYASWLHETVPVLFSQVTRLQELQQELEQAQYNSQYHHHNQGGTTRTHSEDSSRSSNSNNTSSFSSNTVFDPIVRSHNPAPNASSQSGKINIHGNHAIGSASSPPPTSSASPSGFASGPSSAKEVCIQALRCALVLATRDASARMRRRLRTTALEAMEGAMQEIVLGTAGDIALDLCSAAVDGYSIYAMNSRPSIYRGSRFASGKQQLPQSAAEEENEDEEEEGYAGYHDLDGQRHSRKRTMTTTVHRLHTDLTQSQVRLLAEERARELMSRCVDRMLDKDMGEAGRRLRSRVMRMLTEDVALPGIAKALAWSQSASMAAAMRTMVMSPALGSSAASSKRHAQSPPRKQK